MWKMRTGFYAKPFACMRIGKFPTYKKHHSTALDAGRLAAELGVKNLVLYHTEDRNLDTRKQSYMREAAQAFSGTVYVPDDLERINI